ncbi:MAG: hypothetical protein NTV93_06515 [Verrucomicrobia bacterium]|nr:hypothetical protein [Verrucomicrobiota bacterium]
MHDEQEAERLVKVGLAALEIKKIDLAKTPKGSAENVAVASYIRKRTMMTNVWRSKIFTWATRVESAGIAPLLLSDRTSENLSISWKCQ